MLILLQKWFLKVLYQIHLHDVNVSLIIKPDLGLKSQKESYRLVLFANLDAKFEMKC